jgi:hypothetical protein
MSSKEKWEQLSLLNSLCYISKLESQLNIDEFFEGE